MFTFSFRHHNVAPSVDFPQDTQTYQGSEYSQKTKQYKCGHLWASREQALHFVWQTCSLKKIKKKNTYFSRIILTKKEKNRQIKCLFVRQRAPDTKEIHSNLH